MSKKQELINYEKFSIDKKNLETEMSRLVKEFMSNHKYVKDLNFNKTYTLSTITYEHDVMHSIQIDAIIK